MSCSGCNGYYACWCHVDNIEEQIRVKKLEIDSLELKRLLLFTKKNEHEHEAYKRIYKKI